MSEAKHTRGPWIWRDGHKGLYGAGPDNAVLDYAKYEGMWLSWDQGQNVAAANARLIAAAPELLEACVEMLAEMMVWEDQQGTHPAAIKARAAIAKATGEQK